MSTKSFNEQEKTTYFHNASSCAPVSLISFQPPTTHHPPWRAREQMRGRRPDTRWSFSLGEGEGTFYLFRGTKPRHQEMKPSMLSWASRLALIACAVVANCELSRAATSAARAGVVLAGDEWILEFYNTSAELEARQNDTWATGHFVPAGHEGTEGWNKFYVASNDAKPGEEGAYAAGYLEGGEFH